MKYFVLLLALALGGFQAVCAKPSVYAQLRLEPTTRAFTCSYTFRLSASDTTSAVRLILSKAFRLQRVESSKGAHQRLTTTIYLGDTLHQVDVRFPAPQRRARAITLTYAGIVGKGNFTDQVVVFSGHSNWLPFRPYEEYEEVDYELDVRVPNNYQVRSTIPPARQRQGRWVFRGSTSNIELTALVAQQFYQVTSAILPPITIIKAGGPLVRADTAVLRKAEAIVAFYNRTIGSQDTIAKFTIFLPGTNRGAYGLLNDATVISYSDFDVAKKEDLLVLAHEISHKWWAYGSFHNDNGWLSEAFATYSSLLFLHASGDVEGYQTELARLTQSAVGTPAILGFDRHKYEPAMYRRVIYNKGTSVLAALHRQLGEEQFIKIMATTASQKTSTTAGFLDIVEQVAGTSSRVWLHAQLSQ